MPNHDDIRFSSFTRDLARRHRRPRSYPPSPTRQDVLEMLCGGLDATIPPSIPSLPPLPDDLSSFDVMMDAHDVSGPLEEAY